MARSAQQKWSIDDCLRTALTRRTLSNSFLKKVIQWQPPRNLGARLSRSVKERGGETLPVGSVA